MTQTPYPSNAVEPLHALTLAADVRLQGQLTAAVAADQRAMVFAGFLAAGAAALGGAAASVLTGRTVDHYLGMLSLEAAAGLLVSMVLAVIAARPTKWFFPGSLPADWRNDFATDKPEIKRLQELLEDYDDRIRSNDKTMGTNGHWLMASAVVTFLTLLICGIRLAHHVTTF